MGMQWYLSQYLTYHEKISTKQRFPEKLPFSTTIHHDRYELQFILDRFWDTKTVLGKNGLALNLGYAKVIGWCTLGVVLPVLNGLSISCRDSIGHARCVLVLLSAVSTPLPALLSIDDYHLHVSIAANTCYILIRSLKWKRNPLRTRSRRYSLSWNISQERSPQHPALKPVPKKYYTNSARLVMMDIFIANKAISNLTRMLTYTRKQKTASWFDMHLSV